MGKLIKYIVVGWVWTIALFVGIREITLSGWNFDTAKAAHWAFLSDLWQSGWVISDDEWWLVLLLLLSPPIWLTGWTLLGRIKYIETVGDLTAVLRKKLASAKPPPVPAVGQPALATAGGGGGLARPTAMRAGMGIQKSARPATVGGPAPDFVDEAMPEAPQDLAPGAEVVDLASESPEDIEIAGEPEPSEPPEPQISLEELRATLAAELSAAGYRTVDGVAVGGHTIDLVAVAADQIVLVDIDHEAGDWLADEERFNDEEPLWFSESDHRVSPVWNALLARQAFDEMFGDSLIAANMLSVSVVIAIGGGVVINAEDMSDTWSGLNVNVIRFANGGPEELPSLADTVPAPSGPADDTVLVSLREA